MRPINTLTRGVEARIPKRSEKYGLADPYTVQAGEGNVLRLFARLKPEDIGVTLAEGFMMEPGASVSALVRHHPDAGYFPAGGLGLGGQSKSQDRTTRVTVGKLRLGKGAISASFWRLPGPRVSMSRLRKALDDERHQG